MERGVGLLGIVVLITIAWCLSTDRKRFPWRLVCAGVMLQTVIALIMLRDTPVVGAIDAIARVITAAIDASDAGIVFLFGPEVANPGRGTWGFMFVVHA
ncbi:MAG: Na+ dependent nucleoside transporter N-terminal domain-containing protein, partial [Planctomycetota bacterium]